MKFRREKVPDQRTVKITGMVWALEAGVVVLILLGRFVFGWL